MTMPGSIEENATTILRTLAEQPRDRVDSPELSGAKLVELTGLSVSEINDAVTILVETGFAEWSQALGTGPYDFYSVWITPRGRYEYERLIRQPAQGDVGVDRHIARPPSLVGSPYGFSDEDWEIVSERKARTDTLYVVMGYQFRSEYYESDELARNAQAMLLGAVNEYNRLPGSFQVQLDFHPLAAGYGEHLFNEIARDIIGSDIAVFETSDLNPNVMLELGVALTWDVRVLPIKVEGRPKPPSDISGQTWADYQDSGRVFTDPDHSRKLVRMVERAVRKKGHV